jgi:NAD(P)H-dependent FMN reductase
MTEQNKLKIQVILGSTRKGRFSDKPGKWILEEAQKKEGVEAELVDLRDYPLPFFDEPMGPAGLQGKYSSDIAVQWAKKVAEADAYIIAAPEYNHGYPAVLKNALDYAYNEWNNKPVGFVSWGGVAGARVVEQLREVAIELQMAPIRNAVHIPSFWTLLDEKGNLKEGALDQMKDSSNKMLDQLIWWAKALKNARDMK